MGAIDIKTDDSEDISPVESGLDEKENTNNNESPTSVDDSQQPANKTSENYAETSEIGVDKPATKESPDEDAKSAIEYTRPKKHRASETIEQNKTHNKPPVRRSALDDFLQKKEGESLFGELAPEEPKDYEVFKAFSESLKSLTKASKNLAIELINYAKTYAPIIFKKLLDTSKKYPKQAVFVALILAAPIVTIALGLGLSKDSTQTEKEAAGQTLPASFVKEVEQPIYYPATLPNGFRINASESVNDSGLTAYSITDGSTIIAFSQQPDIPSEAFASLFAGAEVLQTQKGTAYIKRLDNGSIAGGMRLDNTTIFLNTATDVDNSLLEAIFNTVELAKE